LSVGSRTSDVRFSSICDMNGPIPLLAPEEALGVTVADAG
jgi:hypothetical protein